MPPIHKLGVNRIRARVGHVLEIRNRAAKRLLKIILAVLKLVRISRQQHGRLRRVYRVNDRLVLEPWQQTRADLNFRFVPMRRGMLREGAAHNSVLQQVVDAGNQISE